jgi:hypothetical protein
VSPCELCKLVESELRKIDEAHGLQLAAISTATFQNTPDTIKDRIGQDNPYWTVAYGDVCRAVDREMLLREENRKLRYDLDRAAPNPQRDFVKESVLLAAKDAEIAKLRRMIAGFTTNA